MGILHLIDNDIRRNFWTKVFFTDKEGCWFWHGAISNSSGHGRFKVKGVLVYAHHFSYIDYYKKEIEEGKLLRHKCDECSCVNPIHLIEGTIKDNIHDALRRGLHPNCRFKDYSHL